MLVHSFFNADAARLQLLPKYSEYFAESTVYQWITPWVLLGPLRAE